MKKQVLATLVTTAFLTAAPWATAFELDSEHKKLSYSLGLIIGEKLKNDVTDLDQEAFREAVSAVYAGTDPLLTEQQVGEVMQAFQQKKMAEQKAEFARIADANKVKGEAYLADNGKKEGVTTTASGLQYEELTAGTGVAPTAEDTVEVHYRGTLVDGTEFDSSYARNEPVSFPLGGVIPGWTEGLQLMKEGGKGRLVIPSDLAYGPGGMGNAIGPNETLVFEVELLKVNPEQK